MACSAQKEGIIKCKLSDAVMNERYSTVSHAHSSVTINRYDDVWQDHFVIGLHAVQSK